MRPADKIRAMPLNLQYRAVERALRNMGFTRGEAKAIISVGYKEMLRSRTLKQASPGARDTSPG